MTPFEEDLEYVKNYPLPYDLLKRKNVFITGATGLIGFQLVKALLAIEDINVIASVRNMEKVKKIYNPDEINRITFVLGDITEPIEYDGSVDFVIHCAAITTSSYLINKPVETIMTSVIGTNNVLRFSKEKKVISVVYISSMEVYGTFENEQNEIREYNIGYINHLNVRSNYPESKRLCENMCISYMSEYSLPVKIARLAQTFGAGIFPWENRVFSQFAKSVINEENIILHTEGKSEGNYCYSRDCVTGLLTILLKGNDGEAYNVSNPKSHVTIAEMANLVADKISKGRINVVYDIPEYNQFGYATDVKLKLNSDKLQQLGWNNSVDLVESYERMIRQLKIDLNKI